jgi:hypothetical protein
MIFSSLWRARRTFAVGILAICYALVLAPAGYGKTDYFSKLINDLKKPQPQVRIKAAQALAELKDPRAVDPLISALLDENSSVRSWAARALAELKDPRAVGPLIAALHDEVPNVRYRAAQALSAIKDPHAIGPLTAALKDEDAGVRSTAAQGLAEINRVDPTTESPTQLLKGTASEVQQSESGKHAVSLKTEAGGTGQSAVPSAPSGKAIVYIYRTKKLEGSIPVVSIYLNGSLLARLDKMDYAQVKAPSGKAFISAARGHLDKPASEILVFPGDAGYVHIPTKADRWTSLPDCATLNWKRIWVGEGLKDSERADATRCAVALHEAWVKGSNELVRKVPTAETIQLCSHNYSYTSPEKSGRTNNYNSEEVSHCLKEVEESLKMLKGSTSSVAHFEFEVEAGKTYYVAWEFFARYQKMNLVDEVTGAKEIAIRRLVNH